MLMKEINLGFHKKKAICFDTKAAMNQHILLLGKSGSGKSTEAQKIILELSRQQRTVLIFDIHSVAAEEQIFSAFRDGFKAKSHEINAYRDGIFCNLFQPLVFADGESEKQPDAVEAVVNMLSRTVKLGSKQRIILRKALFSVINNGSYVANGFASIDFALSEFGTADAESVREKLYISAYCPQYFPRRRFIYPKGKNKSYTSQQVRFRNTGCCYRIGSLICLEASGQF